MYCTTHDGCKVLNFQPFLPIKVTIFVEIRGRKFANFIILSENPVENIATVQNPVAVYKKGELVK